MEKTRFICQNIILILISGVLLFSCQKNTKDNEITFTKFPKEEKVVFTNLFEFDKGTASHLYAVDTTLIIFDALASGKQKKFFYNYSFKNNKLSEGYLSRGRGPGEAIGIFAFGIFKDNLWVYDITLRKITTMSKEKVLKQEKDLSIKEYPKTNYFDRMVFKNDNTLLAVGNDKSKYKIQELELNTEKIITEYGEFKNIPENMTLMDFKYTRQCFILSNPERNKVVLVYQFMDTIEIFDTETHTGVEIKGPEGYDSDFDVVSTPNGNRINPNNRTMSAFGGGAVTDKYIYLLYLGNKDSSNFYYGNSVYVYDWDGNPIKKLNLDRYVSSITVSDDGNNMYASDPNTGYIIQTKINN